MFTYSAHAALFHWRPSAALPGQADRVSDTKETLRRRLAGGLGK